MPGAGPLAGFDQVGLHRRRRQEPAPLARGGSVAQSRVRVARRAPIRVGLSGQTREEKLIQKSEQNQQNDPTDVGETLQQTANETPTIEDRRKKKEERKNGLASPAPFCASDPPEAEPAINLQPLNGEIIAPPVHPPNLAIVPRPDSFEPIEACLRRLCCEGRRDPHPLILAHDFRPIFELESRPEITRNDIENGIRQAIQRGEKPNNGKPLDQWKSCVGWIETAARDRLASGFVRDGPRSAAQDQANREAEFFMSGRSTF